MGRAAVQLTTRPTSAIKRPAIREGANPKWPGYSYAPATSDTTKYSRPSRNNSNTVQIQPRTVQSGRSYQLVVEPQVKTHFTPSLDHRKYQETIPHHESPALEKGYVTTGHYRSAGHSAKESGKGTPLAKSLYRNEVYDGTTPVKSHHRPIAPSELDVSSKHQSNWGADAYLSPISPGPSCRSQPPRQLEPQSAKRPYKVASGPQPHLPSPPPTPPKSHRRLPETEPKPYIAEANYEFGVEYHALPQPYGSLSRREGQSFDAGALYSSARTTIHKPRPELRRDVLAASHGTRADKARLEGFKNPSSKRARNPCKELGIDSDELDELSFSILGDFLDVYHGREYELASAL